MVYTIIPIITLVLGLLSSANASWRFNARTLVTARVDPLISPNSVSSHVHDYAGASNFGVTYDYDNMRSSSCTSSSISVDHSGYWMPSVYYKNRNGSFRLLKSSYIIYYLHRGTNIKAFPAGFRMIAGTATKDSYTQGNAADEAVNFHCLGPNTETPFFPDQACPQGVRVQILFPSCWNGKDITSSNFKDHVAYPVDGKEGNTCPSTHPVRLITLFLEHIIYMDDVDWYPGSLVFSEGDNHGRSSHADFTMGWDSGFLQSAIDQCTDPTANNMCGLLSQHLDSKSADACQPAKYLPLEDVGFYGPISKLLGDNPVWGNGITKATTGSSNTPPLVAPWSVVSSGWQEFGCIDEGDPYTNTMNGDKVVDQSMSPQMCVSHCNGKGFSLAGLGSGDTCFCANQLDHNGHLTVVDMAKCLDRCSGSYYEWCGGGRNLRVWQKTGAISAASNYSYPPAGARLDRVYTADGSSVPVVSAPGSSPSTIYGPNNPPQCPPRHALRRRSNERLLGRSLYARHRRYTQNRH